MAEILHQGATVQCQHGGQVQPTVTSPRVKVGGQAVVTQPAPWTVSGCSQPAPSAGNGPCVTATFTSQASRVKAGGQFVLLKSSQATCTPTGTPIQVAQTQTRVKGQ